MLCNRNASVNTRVKLCDDDFPANHDDFMAAGATDAEGFFDITGSATDGVGGIEPILQIYHVAKKYLIKGTKPKMYDFKTIELKGERSKHDCLH
uniref:Pyr_redox_2 domain-containing protein n=1 Tax=Meloidogyne hapla TaxID=6305 RepID=A0A1I8BP84_MELHA